MAKQGKRLSKAALILVALLFAYPVAANVFLSTPLFDWVVNANKQDGWVQFERAWSVWPGRVHVKKFWLRARDSNMELHLQIDEAAFDISFLALFKARSIHMSDIDATGISFRMRQRISAPEGVPEIVDALPPIPGCERIPFVPSEPVDHRDRWDDAFYELWTVDLSNVRARDVREVWIDSVRMTGIDSLQGGFYFKPLRRLLVGPIDVRVQGGEASMMQSTVAVGIAGSGRLVIDEIDPRRGGEAKLVKSLSLDIDGRARMPDLAAIPRRFVREGLLRGPVELSKIAVHVDHGEPVSGSRVEAAAPALQIDPGGHRWSSAVDVAVEVVRDGDGREPELDVHASAKRTRLEASSRALATIADLGVHARLPDPRARRAHAVVDVDARDGKVVDGQGLAQLVSPGTTIRLDASRGGHVAGHAHAVLDERTIRGALALQLRGLGLATSDVGVTGDADMRADVARLDIDRKQLTLRPSSVVARGMQLRTRRSGGGPLATVERVAIEGSANALRLDEPSLDGVDAHVVVEGAVVPDLRRATPTFESGQVRADADVRLSSAGRRGSGKITAALKGAAARLEAMRIAGAADAAVDIHAFDPRAGIVDVSGSKIVMHDVSVRGASAETTFWKGSLDLVGGTLRLAGPPRFEGFAQLRADDAAPILALAMRDDLPGFLVGSLRAEGLSGQAKLAFGGGSAAVTNLHLQGGTLAVRGDYAKTGASVRGAFVVEKGPVSAGVKIDDTGTYVRLFGLGDWERAEKRAVQGEAEKAKAKTAP
ncbi:MAG: hypothetical protein JST00_22275 [Deltaproteobacteria bacterium]|nr:hypothetical protein [Deltaproteobacteria bacterium]